MAVIVTTTTDPITQNVFFFIEVLWQHSATGNFIVHVDGSEVINETSMDLTDGGAIGADLAIYRISGPGGDVSIDDVYAYSGGTGTGDFLGNAEIFRYQGNTNSSVSDRGLTVIGTTDNLIKGDWDDLGETPLSSDATPPDFSTNDALSGAKDTDDTQSGNNFRPGPNADASIDGDSNIKGAKWIHRLLRGNGNSTTHYAGFGDNSGDVESAVVSLTGDYLNYIHIAASGAAEVPTSTEYFSNGFGKSSGGRAIAAEEIWAMILHVPDAGGTRRIFPVQ